MERKKKGKPIACTMKLHNKGENGREKGLRGKREREREIKSFFHRCNGVIMRKREREKEREIIMEKQ